MNASCDGVKEVISPELTTPEGPADDAARGLEEIAPFKLGCDDGQIDFRLAFTISIH